MKVSSLDRRRFLMGSLAAGAVSAASPETQDECLRVLANRGGSDLDLDGAA